ncbi:hypothetical protein Q8A67_023272 [Cirrhinus molitorella]|uniref:Uncharacterized protein n=1 Tax=Cirrhinus molitorella TaxID=172907 RepID=A0AA88NZM3_9TELE|nr:hypothetical protein Q8A67_023272 [Cirrhinus molitorella]
MANKVVRSDWICSLSTLLGGLSPQTPPETFKRFPSVASAGRALHPYQSGSDNQILHFTLTSGRCNTRESVLRAVHLSASSDNASLSASRPSARRECHQ